MLRKAILRRFVTETLNYLRKRPGKNGMIISFLEHDANLSEGAEASPSALHSYSNALETENSDLALDYGIRTFMIGTLFGSAIVFLLYKFRLI
ncbi:unnamed protein product [Adineta ricciae]|uniref:Uncharacterized protein n=1 Tax=Adineta ricciae TaxID=249248 RepID=A0A815K6A9_ADIRI|nr:unnamed protein product [Adineta ricciae]CAF1482327.1 unnamed protein product [Adineta ricciae]